jgi:hypothetical protein
MRVHGGEFGYDVRSAEVIVLNVEHSSYGIAHRRLGWCVRC